VEAVVVVARVEAGPDLGVVEHPGLVKPRVGSVQGRVDSVGHLRVLRPRMDSVQGPVDSVEHLRVLRPKMGSVQVRVDSVEHLRAPCLGLHKHPNTAWRRRRRRHYRPEDHHRVPRTSGRSTRQYLLQCRILQQQQQFLYRSPRPRRDR
jgi:hypothetical protein